MKRVTMELGGHAPAIVFGDADVALAVKLLSAAKFRNAGQVCIAPTRFLVHDSVYDRFVDGFVASAEKIKVGDGLADGVKMGALANSRRIEAMEAFTADATSKGFGLRLRRRHRGDGRLPQHQIRLPIGVVEMAGASSMRSSRAGISLVPMHD